jgi:rubrerythrin
MSKPTDWGTNRTGIAGAMTEAKETMQGAVEGMRDASTDVESLARLRLEYSEGSEPLGTVPKPSDGANGNAPAIFLDLLGARLAFERSSVRLYELLLVKRNAARAHEGGPSREELEHIRDEELKHFGLVARALDQLGGDPTAVTPSAAVASVASSGILQVVSDPRTTLTEALTAVRMAELGDEEAWTSIAMMAERLGNDELAKHFRHALSQENQHVLKLRRWVDTATSGQAGLEPLPPELQAQA